MAEAVKRLLVAYDGSDPARDAARMAGYIARRTGAEVTVLTVGKIPPVTAGVSGFFVPLVDEEDFLPIVQEGADLVRGLGLEPDRRVVLGDPAEKIIDLSGSEGYDLVVIGHRGLGGIRGLILGSVAKRTAELAPCPVLVVRGTVPEAIGRILVAADGSQHSERALAAAVDLARAFGARITLLYVVDLTMLAAVPKRSVRQDLKLTLGRAGEAILEAAACSCEAAGVECDSVLVEGRPAQAITRRAQTGGYDIVAVGRRSVSGPVRFALGSVSDAVLRGAGRPVLVAGEQAKIG